MEATASATWDPIAGRFIVTSLRDPNVTVQIDSPFRLENPDPINALGCFYSNHSHSESAVITLRLDGKPVGYLFRLSAAFSGAVGLEQEKWFRHAAIWAPLWALQFVDHDTLAALQVQPNATIDQLFKQDCSIAFLTANVAAKNHISDFAQLDAQLSQFGFRRVDPRQFAEAWKPGVLARARFAQQQTSIHLKAIPGTVRRKEFLDTIFSSLVPASEIPVVRFFFYYQAIECLLEELADAYIDEKVRQINSYREARNQTAFRQATRDLQQILAESTLIERLFHLPGLAIPELDLLDERCRHLMSKIGHKVDGSVAAALYAVRNQLFHNFRLGGAALAADLVAVNETLEVILPDMLLAVLADELHIVRTAETHVFLDSLYESMIL